MFMCVFLSSLDEIQKTYSCCLSLPRSLPPPLSLSVSLALSFPLKNSCFFFIQVVLSLGQHQHLIKPKDKHGPRSTAELISSPGSISQLPSICLNTNLLFFTGGKKKRREHQNNAVRSTLLWLFKNTIMQRPVNINYHCLSSALLALLWAVITSGFLDVTWFAAACKWGKWPKDDKGLWKEKAWRLVNIITIMVCLSVSLTP